MWFSLLFLFIQNCDKNMNVALLQVVTIAKRLNYNLKGLMFVVCTANQAVYDTLHLDAGYLFAVCLLYRNNLWWYCKKAEQNDL